VLTWRVASKTRLVGRFEAPLDAPHHGTLLFVEGGGVLAPPLHPWGHEPQLDRPLLCLRHHRLSPLGLFRARGLPKAAGGAIILAGDLLEEAVVLDEVICGEVLDRDEIASIALPTAFGVHLVLLEAH